MLEILLGIITSSAQDIRTIIDCRTVTYRDLSVIEVRYVKGEEFMAAVSYCTDAWLAPTPFGPNYKDDGSLRMDALEDVAVVDSYPSYVALRRRAWPNREALVALHEHIDKSATESVMKRYPFLEGYLHKATFSFLPVPTMNLCITEGTRLKKLLGTIALSMDGDISITSRASDKIAVVAAKMQTTGTLFIPEELGYE